MSNVTVGIVLKDLFSAPSKQAKASFDALAKSANDATVASARAEKSAGSASTKAEQLASSGSNDVRKRVSRLSEDFEKFAKAAVFLQVAVETVATATSAVGIAWDVARGRTENTGQRIAALAESVKRMPLLGNIARPVEQFLATITGIGADIERLNTETAALNARAAKLAEQAKRAKDIADQFESLRKSTEAERDAVTQTPADARAAKLAGLRGQLSDIQNAPGARDANGALTQTAVQQSREIAGQIYQIESAYNTQLAVEKRASIEALAVAQLNAIGETYRAERRALEESFNARIDATKDPTAQAAIYQDKLNALRDFDAKRYEDEIVAANERDEAVLEIERRATARHEELVARQNAVDDNYDAQALAHIQGLYADGILAANDYFREVTVLQTRAVDRDLDVARKKIAALKTEGAGVDDVKAAELTLAELEAKRLGIIQQIGIDQRKQAEDAQHFADQLRNDLVKRRATTDAASAPHTAAGDDLRAASEMRQLEIDQQQRLVDLDRQHATDDQLADEQEQQGLERTAKVRETASQSANAAIGRTEKAQSELNDVIQRNTQLAQSGVISFEEAHRRNEAAVRGFGQTVQQTGVELQGLIARGVLTEDEAREILNRFRHIKEAIHLVDPHSLTDNMRRAVADLETQLGTIEQNIATSFKSVVGGAIDSVSQNLSGVILQTESWADALRNIGQTILNEVVSAIIRIGVEWAVAAAIKAATKKDDSPNPVEDVAPVVASEVVKTAAVVVGSNARTSAKIKEAATSSVTSTTIAKGNTTEAASESAKKAAVATPGWGAPFAAIAAAVLIIGALGAIFALKRNKGGIIPGGGPDEDSVFTHLTPGAAVLNRRTTAALGGAAGIDALNVSPAMARAARGFIFSGLAPRGSAGLNAALSQPGAVGTVAGGRATEVHHHHHTQTTKVQPVLVLSDHNEMDKLSRGLDPHNRARVRDNPNDWNGVIKNATR